MNKGKVKKMSVTEYANSRKISRTAILKRLQPILLPMPGVTKAVKVGCNWVIWVKVD